MAKKKRHKSTIARARRIKAITAMRYEPGNQARCYKGVWRRFIEPEFGICYLTYLRYLGIDPETGRPAHEDHPSLFDGL